MSHSPIAMRPLNWPQDRPLLLRVTLSNTGPLPASTCSALAPLGVWGVADVTGAGAHIAGITCPHACGISLLQDDGFTMQLCSRAFTVIPLWSLRQPYLLPLLSLRVLLNVLLSVLLSVMLPDIWCILDSHLRSDATKGMLEPAKLMLAGSYSLLFAGNAGNTNWQVRILAYLPSKHMLDK